MVPLYSNKTFYCIIEVSEITHISLELYYPTIDLLSLVIVVIKNYLGLVRCMKYVRQWSDVTEHCRTTIFYVTYNSLENIMYIKHSDRGDIFVRVRYMYTKVTIIMLFVIIKI